jgi:hypothetical protein
LGLSESEEDMAWGELIDDDAHAGYIYCVELFSNDTKIKIVSSSSYTASGDTQIVLIVNLNNLYAFYVILMKGRQNQS